MKPKGTVPLHNRTRRKAKLIISKYPGEKARCSICQRPTYSLGYTKKVGTKRTWIEVARYCEEHEIIFPKKRKVISTYE